MTGSPEPPRLLRSLGVMAGAVVATQLVNLAGMLLLARLYPAGDVGAVGSVLGVATIAAPVIGLQLFLGLPQARDAAERAALIRATLLVALGLTVLALLLAPALTALLAPGSAVTPGLVALGLLLAPLVVAVDLWRILAVAGGRVADAGRQGLATAVARLGVQLVAGLGGLGLAGLALAELAGRLVGLGLDRRTTSDVAAGVGVAGVVSTLRRWRHLPLAEAPSALLANLGNQLPVLVMGKTHGLEAAGLFFLAQRLMLLPVILVGQAGQDVLHTRFAGIIGNPAATRRATLQMALALGGIAVAIFLLAPPLIGWLWTPILGGAWEGAKAMALLLVVQTAVHTAFAPLHRLFLVAGRQGWRLAFDLAFALAALAPLLLASRTALDAVAAIAIGQSAALALGIALGLLALLRPRLP